MPRQRAETRERVLDAAERLFLTRGYLAVTIDDIAEKAGFTRGAVYSSFAGKEDVFAAVGQRRRDRALAAGTEAVRTAATDEARLRGLGRWLAQQVERGRDWAVAELEFFAAVAKDPQWMTQVAELRSANQRQLAAFLDEQCQALGVESPFDADELATIVAALASGLLFEWMFDVTVDVGRIFTDVFVQLLTGADRADTPQEVI